MLLQKGTRKQLTGCFICTTEPSFNVLGSRRLTSSNNSCIVVATGPTVELG